MWSLLLQIASGIFGLWLAQRFVPGVDFTGTFFLVPGLNNFSQFLDTLVFVGGLLGLLNYFIKPLLKKVTLPLMIITFNLFTLVISMFLVWLVDVFSQPLIIEGLKALFLATLIVWGLNLLLSRYWSVKPKTANT